MSSFGQVPFRELQKMLAHCAPDHTLKATDHFYVVRANGKTYPSLPKKSQIDKGHVKKMARHLGFLDCAKKYFQQL